MDFDWGLLPWALPALLIFAYWTISSRGWFLGMLALSFAAAVVWITPYVLLVSNGAH